MKAYGSTSNSEARELTVEKFDVDQSVKMELTASKDNTPDFTPGKKVDLEQYFKFTGPVVDVTLDIDPLYKDKVDFKPRIRKIGIIYRRLKSGTKPRKMFDLGKFLVIDARMQFRVYMQVSDKKVQGVASGVYPAFANGNIDFVTAKYVEDMGLVAYTSKSYFRIVSFKEEQSGEAKEGQQPSYTFKFNEMFKFRPEN
jgi:hypothetical protein